MKTIGDRYLAPIKFYTFSISFSVSRPNLLHRKGSRLGDDQFKHFSVSFLIFFIFEELIHFDLFEKNEIDVSSIRNHLCHGYIYPFFIFVLKEINSIILFDNTESGSL